MRGVTRVDRHGEHVCSIVPDPKGLRRRVAILLTATASCLAGAYALLTATAADPLEPGAPLLISAIACAALILVAACAARKPSAATFTAPDGAAVGHLRRDEQERWVLTDSDGTTVAVLVGRGPTWLLRQRWRATNAEGEVLAEAVEDNLLLAVARRLFGHFFGVLRPHFAIGDGHRPIGWIGRPRPWSVAVIVDLAQEGDVTLDRQVALALAYLLAQSPAL
ncbi:MAG: hypothetical protein H0W72_16435 [Planctomycetes bacterium]|nr:hypothetical protein [Planctomycetota bacterium]